MSYCTEYIDLWKAFPAKPDCFFNKPANDFIEAIKTSGVWDKTEIFFCPLSNNETNDLLNWKNPSIYPKVNTTTPKNVNLKYGGTFGDDSAFTPKYSLPGNAVNFKLSEGCLIAFSESTILDASPDMGFGSTPSTLAELTIKNADGNLGYSMLGTGDVVENPNSAIGMYALNRISATQIEWYYNGVLQGTIDNNSQGRNILWVGLNGTLYDNTGDYVEQPRFYGYNKRIHSFWGVFGKLTSAEVLSLYTAFTTFKDSIKRKWSADDSCELMIPNCGANYYNSSAFEHNGIIYKAIRSSVVTGSRKILFSINGSKTISEPLDIGYPVEVDYHNVPALIVDDSGYIHIAWEKMAVGTGHVTPMQFYKSVRPLDFTEFELNVEIAGLYSYNQFQKVGSTLFMIARDNASTSIFRKRITDSTWAKLGVICNNTEVGKSYPNIIYDPAEEKICITAYQMQTMGEEPTRAITEIFYLESADGITWSNVGNTFSKDIVTNGAISWEELNTNCIVVQDLVTELRQFNVCGGVIKNGVPYLMIAYGVSITPYPGESSEISATKTFYWDGNSWVHNDVPFITHPYTTSFAGFFSNQRTGSGFQILTLTDKLICFAIDPVLRNTIQKYSSVDGVDWTDEGVFYSDTTAHFNWLATVYNRAANDGKNILFINKMLPNDEFSFGSLQYGLVMKYY